MLRFTPEPADAGALCYKQKMRNDLSIREEKSKDFPFIRSLTEQAFLNVPESDHTEHLLVERLRQSEAYIPELSLVAETNTGKIVGHILLSKVEIVSENGTTTVLSVAPLSVLPEFQRQGIGGMLLREAHRRAALLGYKAVLLLGHKDYYPRFGYRRASSYGIRFPFNAPDECCMAIELEPDGLKEIHGLVCYPNAFFE